MVKAWFRRHKSAFINIGILVGAVLITWGAVNAPVNINRMQSGDWQDAHIQSVGTVTIQKLAKGAPYADINDIDHISGVGSVKMAQIKRHFTTWDTAKADVWFPGFIIGLILFFGGCFIKYCLWIRHKGDLEEFKDVLHNIKK